jgi:hypothetical protein
MIQKLKEKPGSQPTRQGLQMNTRLNTQSTTNIIPRDSLRAKMIPLIRGSKEPLKRWSGVNFSYPGDYPDNCNYGLRLGRVADNLYLIAIDLDGGNFLDFLELADKYDIPTINATTVIESGGKNRGNHFYYLTDKPFKKTDYNNGAFHGEIRTKADQYIVIPPSKVQTDYNAFERVEPFNAPSEFFEYLTEKTAFVTAEKLLPLLNHLTDNFYQKEPFDYDTKENQIEISRNSIIEALHHRKSYQVTCIGSYLVRLLAVNSIVFDINRDLHLWERVIDLGYKKLYGEKHYLELDKNFLCIIHKEKNPSARIFKRKNGDFVYKDFHYSESNKAFNVVEIFNAIQHNKEPEFLKGQRFNNALIELFEWIESEKIETSYYQAFNKWWSNFETRLKLQKNTFSKYIMLTLQAIINEFKERMRKGHNKAVLAKRYIADRVQIKNMNADSKAFIVNRCMNFLVFSGLLRKGDTINFTFTDKRTGKTKQRPSYYYSIDFECTPEQVVSAFESLIENGIADYNKFKKTTVREYYGHEKADEIFRAKQDKDELKARKKRENHKKQNKKYYANVYKSWGGIPQKGSDESVLPGRGKERSDSRVNDRDRQRYSHNSDTERVNASDNNQLSECNSDTRGAYDRTIQDKHRERIPGGESNESEVLKNGY